MRRIVILLPFVLSFCASGQMQAAIFVDGLLEEERSFPDTIRFKNHLASLQASFIREGYVFSGLDSIRRSQGKTKVYLHQGKSYSLHIKGLRKKDILQQINKELTYFGEHGYPFASIAIDSISITGQGKLTGKLVIERGPEIRYDSAFFFTPFKTNKSYIYQLLDILPGEVFNESNYKTINKKISRSSFLSIGRPVDVSFADNKAEVFLDLKENASSTFEGVLGLQQNNVGNSSIVGSLDLSIENLFRSGHEFDFFWERFGEESQRLSLNYKHSFLFDSKISPSFRFDFLKQDTTFLNRTTGIGINTFIFQSINLLLEYEAENGSLISPDLEAIANRNLADYQRDYYRLQCSSGFFESFQSLVSGVAWNGSVGIGTKRIRRNVSLPDTFYDSIALETNFLKVDARVAYQTRVLKRQAFYHDIRMGFIQNNELLTNERYRLGGLRTVRGFNEKTFFARSFAISQMEFRFYFEQKSFFYLFYDQLIYDQTSLGSSPSGVGLGFALQTSNGQFSFALAGGDSNSQEISFADLRAHFGFITRF